MMRVTIMKTVPGRYGSAEIWFCPNEAPIYWAQWEILKRVYPKYTRIACTGTTEQSGGLNRPITHISYVTLARFSFCIFGIQVNLNKKYVTTTARREGNNEI